VIGTDALHGQAVLGTLALGVADFIVFRTAAARERATLLLAQSERRFRSLAQNAADRVALLDGSGHILYASPPAEELLLGLGSLGASAQADRHAYSQLDPQDLPRAHALLLHALEHPGRPMTDELRLMRPDGSKRILEMTMTNLLDDSDVMGVVANLHDVTQRKWLEDQLTQLALHDSLTHLPNRTLFRERLEARWAAAKLGAGRTFSVLFVDLDGFKAANDRFGHAYGDELLVQVSSRLSACVPPPDTVARWGGDEFGILCQDATDPIALARHVLAALREPFNVRGHTFDLTASIGIARFEDDVSEPDELLRKADHAMYAAKSHGKGRYELFESRA
jgi:diguanylate cyclase (GGDEF)-like protein/PAS domain S-box-containing protein